MATCRPQPPGRGRALLLVMAALAGAMVIPIGVSDFNASFFVADPTKPKQAYVLLWAVLLAAQGGLWVLGILWLCSLPSWLKSRLGGLPERIPVWTWLVDVVLPVLLVGACVGVADRGANELPPVYVVVYGASYSVALPPVAALGPPESRHRRQR